MNVGLNIKKIILYILILGLFLGCGVQKIDTPKMHVKPAESNKDVLMLVLDASHNMKNLDNSGVSKIASVKNLLINMSNQIDSKKTNISLLAFGSGCKKAKLLVKPSNNDTDNIIYQSNNLNPYGEASLAYAIAEASTALQSSAKQIDLIIISSSKDECGGIPMQELKDIKESYGKSIKIYIISYTNDDETKNYLNDLAISAEVAYYDANNDIEINNIISNITDELGIKSENFYGNTFKLSIHFDKNAYLFTQEDEENIQKLADFLKRTNYGAEIQGHTDSIGSKKENRVLAKKQAQRVVDKLIKLGIDKEKIYAVGYGEHIPIATNMYKDGRRQNNRLEAHLIKYGKIDINNINVANEDRPLDIKNAIHDSFIGYYKVQFQGKSYKESHAWLELYANGKGYFSVYKKNRAITRIKDRKLLWSYNKKENILTLDYSNQGKKHRFIKFSGKVAGNTNQFTVYSGWGNRKQDSISVTRICRCELNCIKRQKVFANGVCK